MLTIWTYVLPTLSSFCNCSFLRFLLALQKKGVLRNFANFTEKPPVLESPKGCNFIIKRPQQRCFPLKFATFLSTLNLKNIFELLDLYCSLLKRDLMASKYVLFSFTYCYGKIWNFTNKSTWNNFDEYKFIY